MAKFEKPFEIDRQSITDRVYNHIKQLILAGYLKGGEKVPEEKVAQQLKVSRTPIREALRRLEKYGLIYVKPRSYAVVVELKPTDFYDVSVIRTTLEKLAFYLLCAVVTPEDIAYLRNVAVKCSRLLHEGNQAEAFETDSHFHLEVARRTGNTHLYEIMERLDAKVQLLRLRHGIAIQELAIYTEHHEHLVSLLAEKRLEDINQLLEKHILDKP
jgi:DNA-binding GntR family transcriptional regulator